MKKTNKFFFAMLFAGSFALLLSSCGKDKAVKSLSFDVPTFEEEIDGKAYIDFNDGNKFKWQAGDQVVVYNLDNANGMNSQKAIYSTTANGTTRAVFNYSSGDDMSTKLDGYFVFYPVSKVSSDGWPNANNYQYFNVEAEQTYTLVNGKSTVDPNSMALASDLSSLNGTLTMKPIFGNLRLKLKGTGKVNKIVVQDDRFNLSGRVGMRLHNVSMEKFTAAQNYYIAVDDPYNNPTFVNFWSEYSGSGPEGLNYITEGAGKTMTLKCPDVQLNESTESHFFIGLRPGALKYGFKVFIYVSGNATPYEFDYTGSNNLHYGIKAGVNKGLSLSGIN